MRRYNADIIATVVCFIIIGYLVAMAIVAKAVPLTPSNVYATNYPSPYRRGTPVLMTVKGTSDNEVYVLEADPSTGALPISISSGGLPTAAGYEYVTSVRNSYASVNVTTGAWVELVASLPDIVNAITLFDSCGQTLELGVGGSGAETRTLIIPPGGIEAQPSLRLVASSRISVRAISGTCSVGELDINFFK